MATKNKPVLRQPRPLGTTQLSLEYQRNPTPKTKERLKNIYITAYLNNQLLYKDNITKETRAITIEQLAYQLNQTKESVLILLNKQIAKISNLVGEDRQFARAAIFQCLNWATESYTLSRNQAHTLLASQRGKYQPFLSSAVNQALGNLPASLKPLIELAKLLQGGLPVQSGFNNDGESNTIPGNKQAYLTPDTAIALINQNSQSMLMDPIVLEAKVIDLGTMPEVRANYQGGTWDRAPENLGDGHIDPKAMSREERRDARRAINHIEEIEDADEFKA